MDLKIVFGIIILIVAAVIGIAFLLMNRKNSSDVKPNPQDTIVSWAVSEPTTCSQPCGGGKAYRKIQCALMQGDKIISYLDDKECDQSIKPSDSVDCNTQSCEWVVGDWSSCLDSTGQVVSCGKDAVKKRSVDCPVPDKCSTLKPEDSQICTDLPYCTWNTTDWTPNCDSYVCGKGQQTRTVACYRNNQTVEDKNCDSQNIPISTQVCDTGKTCTWQPEEKWYPYPVPSSKQFDGVGNVQHKLVVSTNQNYGIEQVGNNFVEQSNPSTAINFVYAFFEGVPLIVSQSAGFSTDTDGSLLESENNPLYMLGFTYDDSIKDIISIMVGRDGNFQPIILEKDSQGRIVLKNGKASTNYYPII